MVPEMMSNRYVAFFMSLVSWAMIAMIDGLLTIVYNADIKRRVVKPKEISVTTVVPTKK